MIPPQKFTTSQLADAAGVGPQTLRYYERRGLLPEPPRTTGGHRVYGPWHLSRLLFIQRAQGLGFKLAEIQEILALDAPSNVGGAEVADKLLRTIDEKLVALEAMRRSLESIRADPEARNAGVGSDLLGPSVYT